MRISDWSSDVCSSDLSYDKPFVPDHGFSKERANFIQAGIAPTVAYKVRDNLSVGAGIGLINEFFRARGVIVPTATGPAQLPNHGWSHAFGVGGRLGVRSEEHTSELQSLMRTSSAVFRLKQQKTHSNTLPTTVCSSITHPN